MRAVDRVVVEGSKRCTNCDRAKPVSAFYWVRSRAKHHSWCKSCVRVTVGVYAESPEGRAVQAAYRARPEVKARVKAHGQARDLEASREYSRQYGQTERGRIIKARIAARVRLARATTEEQRRKAQACIDRHTAALAALDSEDE